MSVNIYLDGSPAYQKFQVYCDYLDKQRLRPGQKTYTEKQIENLRKKYAAAVDGGAATGYLDRISGLESFTMLTEAFGRETYHLFFPNPEYLDGENNRVSEINPAEFIEAARTLAKEWNTLRERDEASIRAQLFNNQVSDYLSQLIKFGLLVEKLGKRRKRVVVTFV